MSTDTIREAGVLVSVETDPTPFVLTIAHALRRGFKRDYTGAHAALGARSTVVSLQVSDTPRAATVRFEGDAVTVSHGIAADKECQLTLDDHDRWSVNGPDDCPEGLVDSVRAVLNAPPPPIEAAADEFWRKTSTDAGMPSQLTLAVTDGIDIHLGEGADRFQIHGDTLTLTRMLSGVDDFFSLLLSGRLKICGSTRHLSVLTGASWKVQFDA
ncbi:hypothetical protein [Rhodococcus wratislaviensis]|uniref:hypothetical protein n=1 Tax=Rhodococcus wratislaviensis TaxID=44752 RepID=UPI00364C378A